jgi:tetratricopeptide (TPR) repeat protein
MDPLFYKLGYIYFFLQRYEEALEKFKVSLKYDKNNPEYFFITGCTYYHLHNYSEAINYLEKAIKINPKMAKAFFILGFCYPTFGASIKIKDGNEKYYLRCQELGRKAIRISMQIDKNIPINASKYI